MINGFAFTPWKVCQKQSATQVIIIFSATVDLKVGYDKILRKLRTVDLRSAKPFKTGAVATTIALCFFDHITIGSTPAQAGDSSKFVDTYDDNQMAVINHAYPHKS